MFNWTTIAVFLVGTIIGAIVKSVFEMSLRAWLERRASAHASKSGSSRRPRSNWRFELVSRLSIRLSILHELIHYHDRVCVGAPPVNQSESTRDAAQRHIFLNKEHLHDCS